MFNRYVAIVALCLCTLGSIGRAAGQLPVYAAAKPGDAGYIAEDPQLARLVGVPGPSITLRSIDGGTIDIVDNYGRKPVYLKLWATYCIPCRAQMPGFEKIYETFGDRMQIVAVNAGVGDDAAKVRAFVADDEVAHAGRDRRWKPGRVAQDGGHAVHVLIGSDGRIAYTGHQDGPQLDAAIQRVLAGARHECANRSRKVSSRLATLKRGDLVPRS